MENRVGKLIKELRIKKDFTQRQLAYLADVSNTEISRIEKGERKKPNPIILQKIAKPLNIHYKTLYEAAGYETIYKLEPVDSGELLKDPSATYTEEEMIDEILAAIKRILNRYHQCQIKKVGDQDKMEG